MSWSRPFDDPIPLPWGRQLITLQDAGAYITRIPKKEAAEPEWQAAIEALMLVAELGSPTMMARIGVMRALNRHVERVSITGKSIVGESASWRGTDSPRPTSDVAAA